MDKGLSLSVPGLCEQTGSDTAPLVVDVGRSPDAGNSLVFPTCNQIQRLPAEPLREDSLIIYSGAEQRVREGFSIRYARWESRPTFSLGIPHYSVQAQPKRITRCVSFFSSRQ
jgi:hypothetical protein